MSTHIVKTKNTSQYNQTPQQAWVVFTGETDIAWLRILKSGFRHCFILINDGQKWISVDPISPYMDIQIYHHISEFYDLPKWLETRGYKVLNTPIDKTHKKAAPCMIFTCVESIKRILGIHKRFIITPWQLYQHLEKIKNKQTRNKKGDFPWVV